MKRLLVLLALIVSLTGCGTIVDNNFVPVQPSTPVATVVPKAQYVAPEKKDYTVYITRTGACYHRAGCRYLRSSCIETTHNEAIKEGYRACSICNP